MKRYILSAAALSALVLMADNAAAQGTTTAAGITVKRGAATFAPYAGYLMSQDLVKGPLDSNLGSVNAPVYGVQASLPLAPGASIIGTVGYSSGDLEVGLPVLGGISVGSSSTWVFDAGVELRLDSWEEQGRRIVPLVQLGGGALRRSLSVAGVSANTTDFTVSAGVGVDVPISSTMSLRLLAKDYYGKADFGSVGSLNARTGDLHTVALTGGLRIAF